MVNSVSFAVFGCGERGAVGGGINGLASKLEKFFQRERQKAFGVASSPGN